MKHEELFYSVLCKLYHLHGFVAIEATLSSMLDVLASYSHTSIKSRNGGAQDNSLRYVLSNMKRWKDYWNCSNLQVEFSSGKFLFKIKYDRSILSSTEFSSYSSLIWPER